MKQMMFFVCVLISCMALHLGRAAVPEEDWIPIATRVLTSIAESPVSYIKSGPQNIFYLQTLPTGKDPAINRALNLYRERVAPGGSVVFLGLEPEAAFWATPTNESMRLINSTQVRGFATMVDGKQRIFSSGNGASTNSSTNCFSRSSASGSYLRCSGPGGSSLTSQCVWRGTQLVCTSESN